MPTRSRATVRFASICALAIATLLALSVRTSRGQTSASGQDAGAALYRERCASCHDAGLARTPTREALGHISADNIRFALTKGKMSEQGAGLTSDQIDALVRFLTATGTPGRSGEPPSAGASGACKAAGTPLPVAIGGPR